MQSVTPLLAAFDLSHPIFLLFAVALGACVGSFLNVVIYRVPLDLSVNKPKRSFCPVCKGQIPIWHNLPIISWLMLRGKCAMCGVPISPRYIMVEALTALLFGIVWVKFAPYGWPLAWMVWIFISLLITATFIDLEHFIIPDGITIGGMFVGLTWHAIIPLIPPSLSMQVMFSNPAKNALPNTNWLNGLCMAALGAAAGFLLIWIVVQLGRLAFGRKVYKFDEPQDWKLHQPDPDDDILLEVGDETIPGIEFFGPHSSQLIIEGSDFQINGIDFEGDQVIIYDEGAYVDGCTIALEDMQEISGKATKIRQPREAMGLGDVKFVGMIGAFLGWESTVFTLIAGAVVGAFVATMQKAIRRERWSQPIPFGPYLALGAFVYVFWGKEIVSWYMNWVYFG
ncbi:MAG: prepilin peptidase [Verrucomicrobiota bacterium]